jgi:hypothetical protein
VPTVQLSSVDRETAANRADEAGGDRGAFHDRTCGRSRDRLFRWYELAMQESNWLMSCCDSRFERLPIPPALPGDTYCSGNRSHKLQRTPAFYSGPSHALPSDIGSFRKMHDRFQPPKRGCLIPRSLLSNPGLTEFHRIARGMRLPAVIRLHDQPALVSTVISNQFGRFLYRTAKPGSVRENQHTPATFDELCALQRLEFFTYGFTSNTDAGREFRLQRRG